MTRLYSGVLVLVVALLMFFTGIRSVQAGPFEDFFRELRNSFREANQRSRPHRPAHKQADQATTANSASTNNAKASGPPNERNTRTTARAKSSLAKGELKYGTPVPGKKGLVTSPFSPDAGYIDVRDFPPGTPVKDPYSGKIFLTP